MCTNTFKHTMRSLTCAQLTQFIMLLDAGTSGHQIYWLTGLGIGTISRVRSQYCSELQKSSGGHPSKLTPANIGYAKCIVHMGKADNAVQVTKALQDVTNQSISSQTVCCNLKKSGLQTVVKRKWPLLKPHHWKDWFNLLRVIKSGLWRTGRELYGLIRLKLIA